MSDSITIKTIVLKSLGELNEELDNPIEITDDMVLMGDKGVLDSMDFVNLMVIIEDMIFEELSKEITIVNEKAFSRKRSPFHNIETLTEYLDEIVGE